MIKYSENVQVMIINRNITKLSRHGKKKNVVKFMEQRKSKEITKFSEKKGIIIRKI